MKLFDVITREYSGYDCDGHMVNHLIAADTAMDAVKVMLLHWANSDINFSNYDIKISDNGDITVKCIDDDGVDLGEDELWSVHTFVAPDISKLTEATILT